MLEIRWHGRGGQGAVTASIVLAEAATMEGLYAQAFPEFGPERRGAPVRAYTRISEREAIVVRSPIVEPDVVVVLDPSLPPPLYLSGLKESGVLVINSKRNPKEIAEMARRKVVVVDGTSIVLKILKVPIVNVAMLGALARALERPSLDSLARATLKVLFGFQWQGSLELLLKSPALGEPLLANVAVLQEAYRSAEVLEP
ncbi:MAG: 2-oxoacid:acceptor oxidoreductase family protein [Acidilobaceae archaeon]|nr:2-oxoacid:acceptor oxidoreductase family protein [Acidilobaceae archaeon]MCX8166167.1 2-oxoacid:acceptor oxidoreductase family protein [Acidilobaceae archaeon]MDW7974805.1 2-oxoacid:acceptor oxidoreductase family protein [Sulfolobales archaeon]